MTGAVRLLNEDLSIPECRDRFSLSQDLRGRMGSSAHPFTAAYGFRMRQTLQVAKLAGIQTFATAVFQPEAKTPSKPEAFSRVLIDQAHSKAQEPA